MKSLWWPGALIVAQDGHWCSCYIGYGIKAATPSFQPDQPLDLQDEPDDFPEHYEPVPKNKPPVVLEQETDEQKGDDEGGDAAEDEDD